MSYDNNKTSIVQKWKYLWHKYRISMFAQWVENTTGEYPDDPMYVSEMTKPEFTEDELIQEHINNPNLAY